MTVDPTTPTGKPSDTASMDWLGEEYGEPLEVIEARKAQSAALNAMSPDEYFAWLETQDEEALLRALANRR